MAIQVGLARKSFPTLVACIGAWVRVTGGTLFLIVVLGLDRRKRGEHGIADTRAIVNSPLLSADYRLLLLCIQILLMSGIGAGVTRLVGAVSSGLGGRVIFFPVVVESIEGWA